MRRWIVRFVFLVLLFPTWSAETGAQRMTDNEKAALRNAQSLRRVSITIRDPHVSSATVEDAKISVNVLDGTDKLRSWLTLRVVLKSALEPEELESTAREVRRAAEKFDSVGIRFMLPGELGDRDPETTNPFYAWQLFHGDIANDINIVGLPTSYLAQQIAAFKAGPNDKILGFFVDQYYANGALALIKSDHRYYVVFLIDPTERWLLPDIPKPGKPRVRALEATNPRGTYKADGSETNSLGVEFNYRGSLLVYGGRSRLADKPWLIANPWPSIHKD